MTTSRSKSIDVYRLKTITAALALFSGGVALSFGATKFTDNFVRSVMSSSGGALIGIVAVGLVYEYLLRRSFLEVMEEKVDEVIKAAVPGSIGSIRKAGVVAVYPELNFDRFKRRLLTEVSHSEIRILKMWIPGIDRLTGAIIEAIIKRGCSARIMLLDPCSLEAIEKRASVIPDSDAETVRMNIVRDLRILRSVRARLKDKAEKLEVRLHQSFISMSLLGYGDTYVVGLYWNGKLSTEGPQLKVSGCERFMFSAIDRHFEKEWTEGRDAFSGDYDHLLTKPADNPKLQRTAGAADE